MDSAEISSARLAPATSPESPPPSQIFLPSLLQLYSTSADQTCLCTKGSSLIFGSCSSVVRSSAGRSPCSAEGCHSTLSYPSHQHQHSARAPPRSVFPSAISNRSGSADKVRRITVTITQGKLQATQLCQTGPFSHLLVSGSHRPTPLSCHSLENSD